MSWLRGFLNNIRMTWVGLAESHYDKGYTDGYKRGKMMGTPTVHVSIRTHFKIH